MGLRIIIKTHDISRHCSNIINGYLKILEYEQSNIKEKMDDKLLHQIFQMVKYEIPRKRKITYSRFDKTSKTFTVSLPDERLFPNKFAIYELNIGAYRVYHLINGKNDIGDIVDLLYARYPTVSRDKIIYDAVNIIRGFEKAKLVSMRK